MTFPPSPLGIASPGWKFILPLVTISVLIAVVSVALQGHWSPIATWGLLPAALAIYVAYFFRDPHRKFPPGAESICCPADGKVVSVLEMPCPQMPGGRARRVAIFLNIFNVHIQRTPLSGRVTNIIKKQGKFMNAMNEKCSEENEQVTVWLDCDGHTIGVRQITGAIARRIVCYAKVGDKLKRGERYGLIQFGSRVELFLPLDIEVKVKAGQHVAGGSTLIGLMPTHGKKHAKANRRHAGAKS
jgi:phosphatidylserine decarboxylase